MDLHFLLLCLDIIYWSKFRELYTRKTHFSVTILMDHLLLIPLISCVVSEWPAKSLVCILIYLLLEIVCIIQITFLSKSIGGTGWNYWIWENNWQQIPFLIIVLSQHIGTTETSIMPEHTLLKMEWVFAYDKPTVFLSVLTHLQQVNLKLVLVLKFQEKL